MLRNSGLKYEVINHTVNRGLSAARNTGLAHSIAEYVLFIDSDDSISDSAVECFYRFHGQYDVVMGSVVSESGSPYWINDNLELLTNKEVVTHYLQHKIFETGWNKLLNRKFLIENDIFFEEGRLHEDILWNFKCCMAAQTVKLLSVKTYCYYLDSDGSITSSFTQRHRKDMLHSFALIKDGLSSKYAERVDGSLAFSFLVHLAYVMQLRFIRENDGTLEKLHLNSLIVSPVWRNIASLKLLYKTIYINFLGIGIKRVLASVLYASSK
jgi:glycosyltransferase involved in cell wall biosynthesis